MTSLVAILLGLLLGSMFFSATEIAVTMASRVRLRTRAEHGWRGATRAERLLARPERAIITCLVGNTLVNIAMAAYARNAVVRVLPELSEPLADAIATCLCVPIVLVLGETLPKAIAQTYPNRSIAVLALPLTVAGWLLWPLAQVSFGVAGLVKRAARLQSDFIDFLSREELKQFVAHSEKHGHVDPEERELIYRIFEFWKIDPVTLVRRLDELPRLSASAPAAHAKQLVRERKLGRLILTDPEDREVIGVVSAVGLLAVADGAPAGAAAQPPVRTSLGPGVDRLLAELQRSPSQVAVVETNGATGIILLDDLLQQLLGPPGAIGVGKNPLEAASQAS